MFTLIALTFITLASANTINEFSVVEILDDVSRKDLCALYGPKSTMCLPAVGPDCGADSMNGKGLSEEEKKQIVHMQNEQRRKIATGGEAGQPKASNMRELSWDEDLAVVAQRWADQCKFEHDKGEARKIPAYESVGQNLYIGMSSKRVEDTPVDKAVMAWYNEVAKFSADHISPFKFVEATGHYTQLVWADTYKVGCGVSGFQSGKWWKRLVACNYATAGNMINKEMYIVGEPCSKCPAGTKCKDHLCE